MQTRSAKPTDNHLASYILDTAARDDREAARVVRFATETLTRQAREDDDKSGYLTANHED